MYNSLNWQKAPDYRDRTSIYSNQMFGIEHTLSMD